MGFPLTFIALLAAAVLWIAPLRVYVTNNTQSLLRSGAAVVASGSAPFQAKIESATGLVRTKAMELLRKELHQSVDDLVK